MGVVEDSIQHNSGLVYTFLPTLYSRAVRSALRRTEAGMSGAAGCTNSPLLGDQPTISDLAC